MCGLENRTGGNRSNLIALLSARIQYVRKRPLANRDVELYCGWRTLHARSEKEHIQKKPIEDEFVGQRHGQSRKGHARVQARHVEIRQGWHRREGEEPQTGGGHRSQRGAEGRGEDPAQRKEESLIANSALCARISQDAPAEAPATPGNLIAGARLYREFCAVCRGTSGAPPTPDYLPPGVSALSTAETTAKVSR